MDPVAAETRPAASLGEMFFEMWASVRELVESGLTLLAALAVVLLGCAGCSVVLFLALRGIAMKMFFAASRRELRGRA